MAWVQHPVHASLPAAGHKKADNPVIGSLPIQRRVPDQTTTAVPLMLTISMLPFCPTTS